MTSQPQTVPSPRRAHDPIVSAIAHRVLPFYRRFPYSGPIALTKVDPRGAAIPSPGVFYSRMPKVANSTISGILSEQSGYRRPFSGRNPKDHFLRPSHLSTRQVDALERDWFKFTFVRNPYTRTLSAFLDKVGDRRPQSRPFFAWFRPVTPREPTFTDFCHFLDAGGLWHDMHWAPQTGIMLLPIDRFDFIGRFERLAEDLATMIPRAFGPQAQLTMRKAGPQTGADTRRDESYTDEAREIVARLYAQDFTRLGYDPAAF